MINICRKFRCFPFLAIAVIIFFSAPSAYGAYCKFLPKEPRPAWVDSGFEKPGYYVGVGMAEKKRRSVEEQTENSRQNALADLVQKISVQVISAIKSEISDSRSRGVKSEFSKEVRVSSEVRAEELLRDVNIKDRWLQWKGCFLYTLVEVSRSTVDKIKMEKIMSAKLARVKELNYDGSKGGGSVKARKKKIDEAALILGSIDFDYLEGESLKPWQERLTATLAGIEMEIGQTKGKTAVASLENEIPDEASGAILDHLKRRYGSAKSDRLISACISEEECMERAGNRGFSRLVLVKFNKKIETGNMGSLKGTLTVSYTLYEVESRKVLSGPDSSFAQVIGWSEEDIDWKMAADKIIKSMKMVAGK